MWIDTNNCPESFHELKRTDNGVEVLHADKSECEEAEFELKESSDANNLS